ncbi:ABC transporter ATP-binding protein [Marinomonas spartinae]|uniref:ABC transporter ATP-binding protein n=1 Tax=Marinomonas spartinae TaxID=1792290 RepID=UPI002D7F0E1D|nr:ABC transporter ATP-binding protein [Marinomonas spartinae]
MHKPALSKLITNPLLADALRPSATKLASGALFSSLSGITMLAALWSLIQLLDDLSSIWLFTASLLWLFGALFAALASWLAHDGEAAFSARLRRKVANHLLRLPESSLAKQGDQEVRNLVSSDIEKLHHMVAHLPAEIASFLVTPIAAICLLINMAGVSALWVLLPGVLASLYYLVVVPHINARDGEVRRQIMGEIITAVDNYARGIRVNRIYGQLSGALADYDSATKRFTNNMVLWVSKVATLAGTAVALLQAAATFAIAYLIAYDTSIPSLAATLFFSFAIVTPALRLGHGLDYVSAGRLAMGRLIALLQLPTLPTGQVTTLPQPPTLTLQNVRLTINGSQLLDVINETFPSNALSAITGASGIGKTTLLRVMAGHEPLSSGQIKLAQTDITQLNESTLHQSILLIPQGGDTLPATVEENLRLSAPQANTAELNDALLRAQLNTTLDTHTDILSGGERQRLSIARAFLSDAHIILLDEPTSALDATRASGLIRELEHLAQKQEKTIVMVTHDEELAANTAKVLKLKRMTIAEDQQ